MELMPPLEDNIRTIQFNAGRCRTLQVTPGLQVTPALPQWDRRQARLRRTAPLHRPWQPLRAVTTAPLPLEEHPVGQPPAQG